MIFSSPADIDAAARQADKNTAPTTLESGLGSAIRCDRLKMEKLITDLLFSVGEEQSPPNTGRLNYLTHTELQMVPYSLMTFR